VSGADDRRGRARLRSLVEAIGLEPSSPAPCPYLPGRESRLQVVQPETLPPRLYQLFLDLNFRRLGPAVYRPACDGCRECRQLRVRVSGLRLTRSQRRCLARNQDLLARVGRPQPTEEKLEVYRRYLAARHDGQMSGSSQEFRGFLHDAAPFTREVVFRAGERFVGAGIFDATDSALSAVYFYFDPAEERRAPGVFNVLWLAAECRRRGLPWLYLGYHVASSPKMAYKAGYVPHQILGDDGEWR
jgi:arginine-tRNA-protein transferase